MTLKPKVEFRRCNKCQRIKPLETGFHKLSVRLPSGKRFTRRPDCKDCRNAHEREAYHSGDRARHDTQPRRPLGLNIASNIVTAMALPAQTVADQQAGGQGGV